MERKANYVLIGLFTVAVVAGAFGFVFWIHHTAGKKQSVLYRVIFDTSVSGLRRGAPVLFNGIRVGEVTNLQLSPDHPSQVTAILQVNKATPIRSDTRVGLEFAGLTGVASVSLKGVSATTPLIEREEGEPPTLKADLGASQDMMQAVHDALNNANAVIAENREALHKAIQDLAVFTTALGAQFRQHRRGRNQHQAGDRLDPRSCRPSRQAHRGDHRRRYKNDGRRDQADRYRRRRRASRHHPYRQGGDGFGEKPATHFVRRRRQQIIGPRRRPPRRVALKSPPGGEIRSLHDGKVIFCGAFAEFRPPLKLYS